MPSTPYNNYKHELQTSYQQDLDEARKLADKLSAGWGNPIAYLSGRLTQHMALARLELLIHRIDQTRDRLRVLESFDTWLAGETHE